MNFEDDLCRVLRYGLRSPAEYQPLLKAALDHWHSTHDVPSTTTHVSILGDFLSDEGDPRGDLLHKKNYFVPVGTHWRYQSHHETLPDGSRFRLEYSPNDKRLLAGTTLFGDDPLDSYAHDAEVTPEEARSIVSHLPDENAAPLHQFLDKHFPAGN